MAWTQTQLDALNAAIAEGTLKVEYGDKKVEYRSLNDMFKIRKEMMAELSGNRTRRTYARFTKGLDECVNGEGFTTDGQI